MTLLEHLGMPHLSVMFGIVLPMVRLNGLKRRETRFMRTLSIRQLSRMMS